jgi:hypothetical protein
MTGKQRVFMSGSGLRPYSSLIIGISLIALGLAETLSGEALRRARPALYRAEDPKQFRQLVIFHYIVGAILIVYFLCKKYVLSN